MRQFGDSLDSEVLFGDSLGPEWLFVDSLGFVRLLRDLLGFETLFGDSLGSEGNFSDSSGRARASNTCATVSSFREAAAHIFLYLRIVLDQGVVYVEC